MLPACRLATGSTCACSSPSRAAAAASAELRATRRLLRNRDAIWGDQDAFREALWRFTVQRGVVKDKEIDGNIVCRWPKMKKCSGDTCLIRHHKEQEPCLVTVIVTNFSGSM